MECEKLTSKQSANTVLSVEIVESTLWELKNKASVGCGHQDVTTSVTLERDLGNRTLLSPSVLWNVHSACLPCSQKLLQGSSLDIQM